MPLAVEPQLSHLGPESWLVLGAVLALALHARGWRVLHRLRPERYPVWRLVSFCAGVATVLIALLSPLDALADRLLSAHMAQHLLLMMIAPPLVWLGDPLAPALCGLPERLCRRVIAPLLARSSLRALGRGLTRPAVCWIGFVVVTVLWHLPVLYQAALRSEPLHDFEHVCFLTAGLLFWWPVLTPWPALPRPWVALPYLVLAALENTLFSAVFTFSDHLLYPIYAGRAPAFGLTPLADQALAGAVMWVPGSLAMLIPVVVRVARLLDPQPPLGVRRASTAIRPQKLQRSWPSGDG